MKTWRHARWLALLLWFFLIGTSRPVAADAKDEARILFEAGVAASRSERWLEASEYFRRSLSLAEKPSTWFNLAVAEVKLGHGSEALHALDVFEEMANRSAHAEMLARAAQLREQASALEAQQGAAPGPQTGDQVASQAGATAAAPARAASHSGEDAERRARLLLGAGAVSAVGAVGALVWWRDRDDATDQCAQSAESCLNAGQLERQRRAAAGLSAALGLTALGLLVGGAVWLVRERRTQAQLSVDLGPRRGSATLRWSF